jgi:polysaccharide export outer membrane protein
MTHQYTPVAISTLRSCAKVILAFFCLTPSHLFGQQTTGSVQAEKEPLDRAVRPENFSSYLLGPNDQLKIWVLGLEQEIGDKPLRIDPAGDIDLPLAGKVHAAGLNTAQLKADLIERYSKDLRNPQVSVELLDFGSQPVSVMGAVNRPGVRQLEGHKTLVEAISLAEGLRPDAGPRVNISRQIQYGAIPLPNARPDETGKYSVADVGVKDLLGGTHPAENIVVFPNDVITVPVAETVFVIGDVKKPGEVILKGDGVSVLQALSYAQGFGDQPSPGGAKIVRVVPGTAERRDIPVNLDAIIAGKSEDIQMRPNDILVVPPSKLKKAGVRALEAAVNAAVGVVIFGHL